MIKIQASPKKPIEQNLQKNDTQGLQSAFPVKSVELFNESDIKNLVGLGNYIDIVVTCENNCKNLRTIHGFTEKGFLVSITLNLQSEKHQIKVIEALSNGVVQKNLHCVDISGDGILPIALSHDLQYISVVTTLSKPPLLKLLSGEKLIKVTTKSHNNLQPLAVKFSKSKNYLFACYKTGIDVFSLTYGSEDLLPVLERIDLILPKENLEITYRSRTPIIPSTNREQFLYYLYQDFTISEKSKIEETQIPTLKRNNSKLAPILCYIKQIRIEGKLIDSRAIINLELTSEIKQYEWSNNCGKIVFLLQNNEIMCVTTGELLKLFEIEDPRLKSKEFHKDLLQSYNYTKFAEKNEIIRSVNWLDYGNLILVLSENLNLYLFDSCLTPIFFNSNGNLKQLISVSNISLEGENIKNPNCLQILEKEIEQAKQKLIIKKSIMQNNIDPLILCGNLPYNFQLFTLNFPISKPRETEYFIVSRHLESNKIMSALEFCKNIEDPESFMQSFVHIANWLMRRIGILAQDDVLQKLFKIHSIVTTKPETDYLHNFISQYYHQLGQRLLCNDYYEYAYKIGLIIENAALMRNIEQYCKWKGRLVMAEAAKKEAMKYDQNITTLAQEMTKISDYTHKALSGEDIQNVINDYHTLMNVSSIHELDLDEFNSWEINLKDYEKALQLELEGNYEEAKQIYEKNKLSADSKRAETLSHLMKTMNQNIVQFCEVSETSTSSIKDNKK